MPDRVASAYRHCQALARSHYENFPTASLLLPSRVRPGVAAIYAFARVADDFADEAEHEGRRTELLLDWKGRLDRAAHGSADDADPIFIALADAIERFDLPVASLHDLIDAFLQDVTTPRYATFDDVLDYCSRSANPVGRLVLALHDVRDARSVIASDAICTALQLTNFWQDVAVDLRKDRVYLPVEDTRRFGVTEAQLFALEATPQFRQLLAFEVERTRAIFAAGWPLASGTPGRLGLWLRLVWAGGHAILERIEALDHDALSRRPVLRVRDWAPMAVPAFFGRTSPVPEERRLRMMSA